MLHHIDNAQLPGADRANPQPVPTPPPPAEQTETANVPGPSPDPRLLPPPGLPAAGDPQPSTPLSLVPNTLRDGALSPKAPLVAALVKVRTSPPSQQRTLGACTGARPKPVP